MKRYSLTSDGGSVTVMIMMHSGTDHDSDSADDDGSVFVRYASASIALS